MCEISITNAKRGVSDGNVTAPATTGVTLAESSRSIDPIQIQVAQSWVLSQSDLSAPAGKNCLCRLDISMDNPSGRLASKLKSKMPESRIAGPSHSIHRLKTRTSHSTP